MDVVRTPTHMREWSRDRRIAGRSIGFVPTMGALHDGHGALIRESVAHNDSTVVSLFVNPTQFNNTSDYETYPRTEDDDIRLCNDLGVDAIYSPSVDVMYPAGAGTSIDPGPLARVLEGSARPEHFTGVATVVMKLFAAVEPDRAYFGEKDLQQVAVIRRMSADLDLAVEVVAMPTVREPDGLALSSRNRRLTGDDRLAATCIWRALETVRSHATNGAADVDELRRAMCEVLLDEPRCRIDYAELVDRRTFEPAQHVDEFTSACIAAWFGEVRLIDNIRLA